MRDKDPRDKPEDKPDLSSLTDQQRAIYEMSGQTSEFVAGLIRAGRQIVFPNVAQLPAVDSRRAAWDQFGAYQRSQGVPGFARDAMAGQEDDQFTP